MKKLLLKIARLPSLGRFVGWCIAHLSHVLPLKIIAEDAHCIAFRHPTPSYDEHLLILLKDHARDISCISPAQFSRAASIAEEAIGRIRLSAPHIMLWTNAGRFQDVRCLHFHLFPSELDREAGLRQVRAFSIGKAVVRECVRSGRSESDLLILDADADRFFAALPQLTDSYRLESRGYSVFLDLSNQAMSENRFYIRMG